MNKIYSKVWNKELGQLVVASELASSDSCGATGAGRVSSLAHRSLALAIFLAVGGVPLGAMAATAIGTTYITNPDGSICTAVGTPAANAIGAWTCQVPNGDGGYAILTRVDADATGAPVLTGLASKVGTDAVAIGTNGVDYTRATGNSAVAVGTKAWATEESAVAVGDRSRATGKAAVAIGYKAEATGTYATALGAGSKAYGDSAYAMGNNALAREFDVAIGGAAMIDSTGSTQTTALGYQAGANSVDAVESTFIGVAAGAQSSGKSNAFVGSRAGAQSVGNLNVANGAFALAGVQGSQNVAQGNGAGALVTGDRNVAIGQLAGSKVTVDAAGNPTGLTGATYSDAVNIGSQTQAFADGAVAVGAGAAASKAGGVALGRDSVANTAAGVAGYNPLGATPAGATWNSTLAAVSVGAAGKTRQITNVAAGTLDTDAVNVAQLKAGQTHYYSVNDNGVVGGNYDNDGATGTNALAAGVNASAVGTNSLAIGNGASARPHPAGVGPANPFLNADNAIAIGFSAVAGNSNTIAMGVGAQANRRGAIAIGTNARVLWDGSASGNQYASQIAIGGGATVGAGSGGGVTAIGAGATTDLGNVQTAIGASTTVRGNITTAMGAFSIANGDTAAAVGVRSQASGYDSIAFGTDAIAGRSATGGAVNAASALGVRSAAQGGGATAVGTGAYVFGNGSGAVSAWVPTTARISAAAPTDASFSIVGGTNNFAIGNRNLVGSTSTGNVAFGNDIKIGASGASFVEQTVVQNGVTMRYYVPTYADQVAIQNAVAIGQSASVRANNALAIGNLAASSAVDAIAIGNGAQANGAQSISIGTANVVNGAGSGAIGDPTVINGAGSYSLGNDNTIDADEAGTFGNRNVLGAAADGSRIIGNDNDLDVADAFVMGNAADVSVAGGVALGSGSVSDTGAGVAGYNPTTGAADGLDPAIAATTSTAGAVAVGNADAGVFRQITGVAAGTADSDAVNVAQLKRVSATANAGWNATDADGNLANIGPDGTVTFESGNANLTVAQTGADDDGVVEITLADNLDLGAAGSVTTGDTVVDNSGVAVGANVVLGNTGLTVVGGTTTTVVNGDGLTSGTVVVSGVSNDVTGLSNTTWDPDATYSDGRAATEEQLKSVSDVANAGWNATDANGNVANIGPNGTVTFEGDSNVTVSQTGVDDDGVVEIALNRDLDLDSVTTGDTVINNAGVSVGTNVTLGNTGLTIVGGPSVTLAGIDAGGTVITNVAPGVADTDAVNVSQLNDVSDIANAGWNATDANGNLANIGPNGTVTFEGDSNVTVSQTGVDDDGVVEIALNRDLDLDSVTTGDTVINNAGVSVGTNVTLGNTGLVIAGGPSVTTAGIDAGGMVITNVAAGVADTDAVNVSQLQDTVDASKTKYYSVNSKAGGNEANDGATGADAIASGKDAEAEGDEAVAIGLGASAAGEGSVALGSGAQALSLNSLAMGAGAVASHENSIAMGAGSATTVGAQANYTGAYVGNSSSTGEMNVGGRQITGVAAGSAATDAVNVSQLQGGVNTAITESKTYTDTQISNVNTAITNLDNRVTSIEGDIIDIQGDITDIRGDIVDIQGDITNLDDRVNTVEGDVANLTTTVNEFDNRVTNVENGADGMFQVSQEGAIVKPQPTGTNSSAGGNGASAGGSNALAVGNQSNASGSNSTAIGTGATASAANSTAIGQGATASHANSVALGQGSATTVGAQTNYNAAYVGSSTSKGEVNMGGRTITGVAPGIAGTDAVNVNQLNGGVNHAINVANQYTDSRITGIQTDVWQMQRDFRGATSSAMAMAGLPQAYLPGKSMVAVGFGGYQGEYGMAFGLSGITENGRYVYKAQASGNTSRDWGFSVGAGLQW